MAGLRYESGREMPPGMQELYAVQEVAKMISDGQMTKEVGLERITPQPPMAAAPLQGSQGERIATASVRPGLAMTEDDGDGRQVAAPTAVGSMKMPYCGDAPEREDLPGCPFCGSENLLVDRDSEGWYLECNGCLAEGPRAETQAEAERRWARRY